MSHKVDKMAGFDDLPERDKAELRRFETMLCTRDKVTRDPKARLDFLRDTAAAGVTGSVDERIYEVLYEDDDGEGSPR